MPISRRHFLGAAAGLAFARPALAQTAAPIKGVRFALDWALEGQQSPFVLAADGGYFERAGVEVKVDRGYGSGDTVTKIASGAYDIGFADLGAAISFNGKQNKLALISVFQVYDIAPMSIMTLKGSGIAKPADLVGKTIAAPTGDSSRVLFPVLAKANGFDPKAVNWLDVSPALREPMLAQKRAQAISAQITSLLSFRPLGIVDQVEVMKYADFGLDLYGHGIITTPEYAKANPEAVKRVVRGIATAWQAALADPAKSAATLVARDKLTDGALETDRLNLVIGAAVKTPGVLKNGLSQVDAKRMAKTITAVADSFGVPAIGVDDMYRPDFLPDAAALKIG